MDTQHEQAEHHDEIPKDLPKVKSGAVAIALIVALVAFAGLFALGWFPRQHRINEAEADAKGQSDTPAVEVKQPARKEQGTDLWLPADIRAMQETSIYPRANGYLKRWVLDVGQPVKAGELLAEIDEPEVDAQLNQSKAQLEQSKANVTKAEADLNLAKVTLQRYLDALKNSPGSVTAQDVDEKKGAYESAASALTQVKASVVASQAEVQRLETMQGFERILAPFDGIVTARNYDIGALLSSGNTQPGSELFRIQQTDTLRAFVNVPQNYITAIKTGQTGFLKVRNYSDKEFKGTVVRSTGALDPTTRTLRFEVDFPNKDGALFAGMYGQLRLVVGHEQSPMTVPTSAVVFDADGTKVGIVEDNKFHFRKVELGQDFGTDVEVASGLNGDEQVVTNPGIRMNDGSEVRVSSPTAAKPASGQPKQQLSER